MGTTTDLQAIEERMASGANVKHCDIEELIEEIRELRAKPLRARQPDPVVAGRRLLEMFDHMADVKELSDEELSAAVISEVWAELSLVERENSLLSELVERFRAAKGLPPDA